ncbi:MAG: LamG-like jellyroll fold domain-containing protein, partial [Candidatus Spyradenecus sp.]
MSFWMMGLLALLPVGFSAQAADVGVTMLHKMDFEAVTVNTGNYIAPKDLGSGARAFPMSMNGGVTFNATKATGWNGSTVALGTGSSGIRFRNGYGLGASTATGWTLSFQAQAAGAPGNPGLGPIGMTLGKVGEGDNLSLHLNVNITNNQGYALAVKRANTTDIAADQATVTVVDGTNMAPFSANEWHHYAVRCVPDAGGGQPTFELWQDGERKGAIKVAGIADGTWVIKELLIGRTRGDGHQSTPEAANTNYQNAPGAQQSLDEVALFDRALSDAGVAWLKDNAAAVPPTDQPASVMGAVLGTMNQINVSNASVTTIKFGSSELALTGPEGASAIRAGTKLESVSVFFRDGGGSNGNAKYLVLTDTADKVLGVSDAAEPLPVAATVMTVAYPFSEAPTIDSTSTYRLYLTAQENLSAGDTFSTSNAVTARFLALQKATSSADFTFNTSASNYAPAMSFQLRVPRALNVNFTVGESPLVEGTDYGVAPYPAAQWRSVTTDATEENITITQEVTDTVGATVSLTAKARLIESSSAGTAYPLFRDTLMDSGADANAVSVELANIPYKHYDLYIYMAAPSGTAGYFDKNGPVFLNDDTSRYYYMEADRSTASVSATPTSWGSSQDSSWGTAVIGTNVLRIADLTDETIKVTAHRMNAGDEARGAITAIQVVEVPTHGLAVWSATLTGDDHLASTQPFTNTRGETKLLGELTEADCAEVTVVGAATLTLDAAAAPGQLSVVGGGTLTLAGAQTLTTEMTVSEGTLAVTAETAALEGCTITVASDATLAPRTTVSARVTGAGSVTIEAGQTGALANTANDFAGGTTVAGTLLWQGAEAYGTAPVTVNAGGVFDLNGLPCAQAVTLAGGALKGAFDAATDTIPAEAFSVNFNQDQGKVSDSETGGLVAMRGSYWVNSASASGTNQALTLVPYNQIASAGASTQALANALSWTCRGHWVNGRNQTSYLKGYLDENENIPVVLTFSLPEEKVKFGWDLYLYANTDTGGATFSAKDLTGDDGVTTSYTYRNGALVTGSTAGFGNSNDGTTTVAEGVNVLKVPGLTDRSLRVNSPNRNGRGCIAAVQGVFCKPNGYYGALTVTADSVLAAPEAGKALRLGYATVSGSGKLTKQGAGELRLVKSTFGAQTLAVAEGTCSVGEGNALESLNVTVGAGTTFAAEAGMESLALASLAGEGTVELGDLTALTLTGSGAGTASFTGNFTATTRTVAADVVCALIKRGANTQQLAQLPTSTSLTFEVQAQAGTLRVVAATEQTLKRLVTTGGTFATDGVGEVSVDFAQMASGAATFASRATAKSARPAMESAGDATVSKFTLAEGGKILYYSRADLAKYFPAGFIPEGEYTVQLGADLYSELSYPTIFTVMGAPVTARFTVLDSTGNPAPSGSWSASGNTITISDSSAITGTVEVLGAPKYHYTFNNGNLVKADDALEDGSLQNEGATYAASDNGKCLASGTPWSGGFRLESGAWSFGTYFRLKAAQEKDVVFGFGQAGTAGALYLTKGAGNTVTLWHNPTGSGVVELFTVPLAGSSETWNHLLLVHTEGTITCYINGVQLAVAKGDFAKTLTQFQVGSFHGGVGHGFTKWAGHDGQVDDLAVWSSALVGRQVTQAAAKVMGHWRWREGETPAEALDAAAADWQNVEGILGSWPGTADDSNYTAAVSITASASLEELVEAMASFPAREVLWDGAQVSFAAGETALALPAGSPRLAVANAVTVDLSGAAQRLIKAAYAGQTQVTLADGLYSGEVTLRNAPEGLQVALATGVAGLTVQVALEMPPTGDAYERTITANANWNEADAWTNLADSTTVDVPPAGATVFLTVTADATLTMGSERPELADLFVDGAGALTLDYGTLGLTEKDDYANAPFERTLLTVTAGVPENLTIRTSALNYGAYATIAYTETAVVATVNAPEGLWQESGTERIISINFADAEANKVTGTAQEGLAGYEVHAALWSQFVGTSQTGQVNAYDYADRADGSAAAVATGTLTYTAGTVWKTTAVDANARGLFKGYLDDNGSSNWADSTLRAEVVLPADWSARYTAILYKAADTNLDKTKFTPALINGVWYSYVNEVLTSLANFPASTLPGAEYDWGSLKARQEYTAGTNVMVVSGLSGQTFTTEKWASRGAWTSFDARGGLAAIQLKEEKSLEPGEAKTFIAEASGNLGWASLSWRDENGHGTGTPTATDAATIVLTDDLSLDLSGVSVKHLTICGNGHAVSFSHRAESTVGAWAFVNDTVLLLTQQGEALPANTVVYPKRVRYAYPYEGDVTTTNRYEQEFANSFTGALTPQGGLVEFSKGAVHFTGLAITATETDLVFSGNSAVTLDEGVPFSFGTANLIFKDTATVTAEAMRLCDEGPARTVNLAMTDDATITITGNVNDLRGNNSLLWPHWSGTLNASLRDRAKLIAEQTVMTLGCADADTLHARLTLADEAEIRVEGLYAYSDNASTSYDINLKGGKLLIGSRGWGAWNGVRPISLNFQGGTFGAWQDVELLSDTHRRLFSEVTGNPLFAGEATMTFASPVPMFTDTAARATVRSGGLVLQGKDFAALPSFQLQGGTLTLENCSPTMSSLTLSGGALDLAAGFPTVSALSIPADTIIRLPLREKLSEGGYITMADGRQIPAIAHAVFELALDPNRSETSRVLPLVPLVLGGYTEGTEPQVKGFGVLNNTNSAISDYAAVFRSGSAGRGLYAELKGNEVLKEHTVHLNAATEALEGGGYPLIQSTLDAYPYHIFSGELANAKVLVPEGGVALPHAAFIGTPITLVAQGSTPGTLLQGINYTFSTDVTFDLSAWAAAMPTLVRGAVKGVPASVCLISGGAVKAPASVRLKVDLGAYALPSGVEGSVEVTAQGVYYVLRYERRVRTLSVNFTESTVPLVAPPAQVGAYSLPIGGWNSLEGVFSSATLKLSDVGGVAQEAATAFADPDQPTQLLCYTSQTNLASSAGSSLLQVRLDDSTEQQLRLVNVPFEAYRVALIFANDLEGAAYATATINGSSYAMDAEGYTRRDIAGYTALDAKGNPSIDIPADTQWGSTDFTPASAPVTLGTNALVSDVLTASEVTIDLPGFTYAQRYAGLAALQIIEAPDATAAGQILTCAYTFTADGDDYELATLPLTGTATTWSNGPENLLSLTSDYDVTLTLPKSFEADRIICSGSGSITLRVEGNGGAALRELDAAQIANITVDFPAAGLVFAPASEVSRFEQSFDNCGNTYTIAAGATLALGEHSGIVTEFDDNGTATLDIDEANSRGVLRRDYPVTQT